MHFPFPGFAPIISRDSRDSSPPAFHAREKGRDAIVPGDLVHQRTVKVRIKAE